jgi:phosphate transport system protein
MANDLRFITSAMKIASHLERIGEQAVNIAERSLELITQPLLKPLIDIPRMAELAQEILRNSINFLINNDVSSVEELWKIEDVINDLNSQIFRELVTYMIEDPKNIKRAIELILVGRNLERIADLSTNIVEEIVYIVNGEDIKHFHREK